MPAPLVKGIILLSSVLIAAGIAAYEDPEVRAWFEERKRKIALTINEIADEFDPTRPSRRRRFGNEDASTREDNSPEAVERRRRARQEIMERGLVLDQRRRNAPQRTKTASSFDDIVDSVGKLKEEDTEATSTAIKQEPSDDTLRHRTTQAQAVARGSAMANPFDDEMGGVIDEKVAIELEPQPSIIHNRTIAGGTQLRINTTAQALPTDPEAQDVANLQDLTPTTSIAASTLLSGTGVLTPASTRHPQSNHNDAIPQDNPQPIQSYQSIQEWASAAASSGPASFYSPPESERNYQTIDASMNTPSRASSTTASIIGTNDVASEAEDSGVDLLSNAGAETPMTWSEVGSQISDE